MQQLLPAETSASLIGQVHLAECLELCERVYRAGLRVDMILADLPYGTTACAWDTIIPFEPMWKAFKRIIKPRGAIVLTACQPFTSALVMSNPKMFRYEWIWEKTMATGFLNTPHMPLRAHENILIFGGTVYYPELIEGKPYTAITGGKERDTIRDKNIAGVVRHNTGYRHPRSVFKFQNETGLHPTQKPTELFRYLVRTYTEVGQVVFDPTCGSGTTGLAATIEKRRFICGDSDPGYVDIARNRLRMHNGDVSDLPLFAQPA